MRIVISVRRSININIYCGGVVSITVGCATNQCTRQIIYFLIRATERVKVGRERELKSNGETNSIFHFNKNHIRIIRLICCSFIFIRSLPSPFVRNRNCIGRDERNEEDERRNTLFNSPFPLTQPMIWY